MNRVPPAAAAQSDEPDEIVRDAERSVLAAMMLGGDAVTRARALLKPEAFYRAAHGVVFEAIGALADRGEPADLVTVAEELKRRGDLAAAGGPAFVANIMEAATTTANVEAHSRIVRAAHTRRGLARLALDLQGWAEDPTRDLPGLLAHLQFEGGVLAASLDGTGAAAAPAGKQRRVRDVAQGKSLRLNMPEPWPDAVDGPALLDEVACVLRRYVILPAEAAVVVALWVVLTYLTDVVDVLPRLLLTSPTRSCGKSRLLSVLGALVCRPLPTSSITASATFRVIAAAHPTLLLDEMDNARLNQIDELRAVLNSGHERANAWTVRSVGEDHEPRHFSTWAAVAFACIGRLPDTVASRCVTVPMRRRGPGERVERLRGSRLVAELEPTRRKLARWSMDHAEGVRDAEPRVPGMLEDRAADNWTPLLAIADAIGGAWPERARSVATASGGLGDDEAPGVMLLSDLRALFTQRGAERLASEDMVSALLKLEARPWGGWRSGHGLNAHGMARLLKPFGVESRTIKWPGGSTSRGYLRESFDDAFARYLPPDVTPATPPPPIATESVFSEVTPVEPVSVAESGLDPRQSRPVSQVSVTESEEGRAGVGATETDPRGATNEDPCPHCGGRVVSWDYGRICTRSGCRKRLDAISELSVTPLVAASAGAPECDEAAMHARLDGHRRDSLS